MEKHLHNHLPAAQERVADELARAESDFGHDVDFPGGVLGGRCRMVRLALERDCRRLAVFAVRRLGQILVLVCAED